MARQANDVTEAELAVLQALWDRGPCPIRSLAEAIYGRGDAASYATVQKLLERLEAKGFVVRDRGSSVHQFAASVNRDELIGRRLRDLAESLCGGSIATLASHLIGGKGLSDQERKALRKMVEGSGDGNTRTGG